LALQYSKVPGKPGNDIHKVACHLLHLADSLLGCHFVLLCEDGFHTGASPSSNPEWNSPILDSPLSLLTEKNKTTSSATVRKEKTSSAATSARELPIAADISGVAPLTLLIQKGSRPSVFTGMCTRRSHRSRSVTQGHRGNHVARTRATARRTVMKESRKCRSGRGCRPHRRDDATLSAWQFFPAEGEKPWSARRR